YDYLTLILSLKGVDCAILNSLLYSHHAVTFFDQLFVSYTDSAREIKSSIQKLLKKNGQGMLPVNVSPMPICLMKGYENYVGVQETAKNMQNKKIEFFHRGTATNKNEKCLSCVYMKECDGFDVFYVKKKGWHEMVPVKKFSPQNP
ncbi:MAG: hypothetical protein V2B13_12770, partial [Pseudomonadota bacterium]